MTAQLVTDTLAVIGALCLLSLAAAIAWMDLRRWLRARHEDQAIALTKTPAPGEAALGGTGRVPPDRPAPPAPGSTHGTPFKSAYFYPCGRTVILNHAWRTSHATPCDCPSGDWDAALEGLTRDSN